MFFDRKKLNIKSLSERVHDLDISIIRPLENVNLDFDNINIVAGEIIKAKKNKSSIILMIGGHVIRSGIQRYIIDLLEKGYISCLAMNGSCVIHDYEFSLIGATTESVARYISEGQFGLWQETGQINDIINKAYKNNETGFGSAIGKFISESDFQFKDISILSACYRLGIPTTVHIGIGYDIIDEHPNFDGAAAGKLSYDDFLIFTKIVENLEGGVVMNFGSAVMAPEVYLKALSMARNVAHQIGDKIQHFTTLVCDLHDLPNGYNQEPSKNNEAYYFRPWKTMLVRTVADGGKSYYINGKHSETIPQLWSALVNEKKKNETDNRIKLFNLPEKQKSKIFSINEVSEILAKSKRSGKKLVHCHGCFDLMHPGHIKYFQAAKEMGDILLVTLSADRFVDKGPGRPVFNENIRAESIAALECVDYVAINEWPTAEETLRLIRPDIYVKGQEFEKLEDKTGKIQKEAKIIQEIGGEMRFTHEIVFSSTQLLNTYFK